jgi:indolepyruvate ferredoxin oxidoreductase alpha subunit
VNHQSGIVEMAELRRTPFKKVPWPHEPTRFITVANLARAFKLNMLERTAKLRAEFEASPLNMVVRPMETGGKAIAGAGIIASGAGFNYAVEACRILGLDIPILKLGTTFPLPAKLLAGFIGPLKRLVIVEELSPYLEQNIKALAKEVNPGLELIGKEAGYFSEALEYNPDIVATALAKAFGVGLPVDYAAVLERSAKLKEGLPSRPPTFCPGCPHRGTLYAIRKALKGVKHVVAADIGCYSMAPLEPLKYGDTLLSMGASLGVAEGLQYAVEEPVIALIGDSTFLHAGLPGLVNAIHQKANFKLVILDNAVTAMTGQQHNPSTPHGPEDAGQRIDLEALVKGLGITDLTVIDPYQIKDTPAVLKEAFSRPGIGVVISRRDCALYGDRNKRRKGVPIVPNKTDKQGCKRIYACVRDFHCPAISIDGDRQASIDPALCDGCMMCSKLCPMTAIRTTGGA